MPACVRRIKQHQTGYCQSACRMAWFLCFNRSTVQPFTPLLTACPIIQRERFPSPEGPGAESLHQERPGGGFDDSIRQTKQLPMRRPIIPYHPYPEPLAKNDVKANKKRKSLLYASVSPKSRQFPQWLFSASGKENLVNANTVNDLGWVFTTP